MAIIDVVKWVSTPDVFAWKFPQNNLSTKTQLIVYPTQEAVLFSKGKLLAKFNEGKHTLSTENIPVLREFYGIPFGGTNPFTAEVWFVNKIEVLDIKWGTAQPFLIKDPQFNLLIPIRANGQFGISIDDSEKFLLKLVGNLPLFDRNYISNYFKGVLLAEATSVIAKKITEDKISIVDLPAHTIEISEYMHNVLKDKFSNYGICIQSFYVNSISFPERDDTLMRLKSMLAKRAEMEMLGYTYQQERSFDVMHSAAKNTGTAGDIMGVGVGLGMGFGAAGAISSMFKNNSNNLSQTINCNYCHNQIDKNMKYCPFCGHSTFEMTTSENVVLKCDKCGCILPAGAKFCFNCGDEYHACPHCGADIDRSVGMCPYCKKNIYRGCSNCGAPVPSDAKFCAECGFKQ